MERKHLSWVLAPRVNSFICLYYSSLSLLLFLLGLYTFAFETSLFSTLISSPAACAIIQLPSSRKIHLLFFLYYLSKFHEYSDIILVLLTCRPPLEYRLHPHFRYHHLTTPFFAYCFLHYQCGHHAMFMLANLLMHAFVYRFHAGPECQSPLIFWLCRIWGYVQLLLGMSISAMSLYTRLNASESMPICGTLASDAVPLALYALYFVLLQYQIFWPWPPKVKNA